MAPPESDAGAVDPDRRRDGRGRLSTIDALPEEADEDIAWANEQLRERKMPQNEILRQFNARLADKGIASIKKSAFNRYSVRLAIEVRKMEATRQITSMILARLPIGERSDSMIAATELIKYRVLELVTSEDEVDLKQLGTATAMLQKLSATAARETDLQRKQVHDQREEDARKAAAELAERERADAQAAETASRIASDAGLSAERVAAIRKGVLGLAQ